MGNTRGVAGKSVPSERQPAPHIALFFNHHQPADDKRLSSIDAQSAFRRAAHNPTEVHNEALVGLPRLVIGRQSASASGALPFLCLLEVQRVFLIDLWVPTHAIAAPGFRIKQFNSLAQA